MDKLWGFLRLFPPAVPCGRFRLEKLLTTTNASVAVTEDEIKLLFDKGLLGLSSPEAILNTLWLSNSLHFGLQGVKEPTIYAGAMLSCEKQTRVLNTWSSTSAKRKQELAPTTAM